MLASTAIKKAFIQRGREEGIEEDDQVWREWYERCKANGGKFENPPPPPSARIGGHISAGKTKVEGQIQTDA